jgi:S-DNA-T family DNA segregation ATPase FtsK/SpoIIIE
MPKRKKTTKTSDSGKGKKKNNYLAPILRLLLAAAIVVPVVLFWPNISSWAGATWGNFNDWVSATWEGLLGLFGLGLLPTAVFLGILIWTIASGRFGLFTKYWKWWLGGIPLVFAAWGVLAFFSPGSGVVSESSLGGSIGKSIISDSYAIGALRILGLVFLGVLIIVPRWTWRTIKGVFKGIGRLFVLAWQSIRGASQRPPRIKPETEPEPAQINIAQVETREPVTPPPAMTPAKAVEPPPPEAWEPGKYNPVLTAGGWQLPPITILDKPAEVELSRSEIEKRAELIQEALGSYGVDAKVVQINVGPTVTQFGVEPGWDRKFKEVKERDKNGDIQVRTEEISKTRVKVDRISALASDLALALAASSIRIEAPVPGKSMVGIEVPNTSFGLVNLRSVIESPAFQKTSAKSKLALALGKGAGGETVAADLARMPHLLIAGATGSGKTACLNSTICSLLIHNTPDDVKFIMIDPKRVELVNFNTLPHLIAPVVVDADKAVLALRWLNQEMDNRYQKFAQFGARNIEAYNKNRNPGDSMPYIVLVIDELADLMMAAFTGHRHTSDRSHSTPIGGRCYRPHQSQFPHPHQLRADLTGRLAHHSRCRRCRKAVG